MTNILEFKKKVKQAAPKDSRYVLICVDTDGEDGSIEHSPNLNGYEVLGIMEWAKSLKLAECAIEQ